MIRRMIFPVLLGLVGCGILISLGVWQVHRLAWKEALIAAINSKIHTAPVALPLKPDPKTDRYLAVSVSGHFTGKVVEDLIPSKFGVPGVRVIEGFVTNTGRRVMVDRGFLPDAQRKRAFPPDEPATVTGNLDWPQETDSYTPPPDPKSGLWFARDVLKMAKALGTEPVLIVASGPKVDGIQPYPVNTQDIPNGHFGYALTWFSLAIGWAVMTLYLMWRIWRRTV